MSKITSINYKAIKIILSKMPSCCFSCTNTNDKRIRKKEGGKTEEMEEGMEGKREGTRKERTIPHYFFFTGAI